MSLRYLIDEYIEENDVIISAASGEGATTLALHLAMLLSKDKLVIYHNSTGDIDRNYVKEYYPLAYKNIIFTCCEISILVELLIELDFEFDYLVIDPADPLLRYKDTIRGIKRVCNAHDSHLICTSQLRLDPKIGWQPYSTVEELNKKMNIFDYSIWMRKVTEDNPFYISKYIDVYKKARHGNKYISRYIVKFDKIEGCLIA